jgi:hypothetical protein
MWLLEQQWLVTEMLVKTTLLIKIVCATTVEVTAFLEQQLLEKHLKEQGI